jgi:Phage integrase, N-terminal SAM-like domain
MNSRGNLQRKCVKAHPKAAGKCSGRCIRYYPRLELPRRRDGTRRFEALGGYPTRAQAEAALADALARRSHGLALDPAKLTVDQYLDRWLTHVRTSRRARTVASYTALLRDHVRPALGARPLKQLTPLEVQAAYDRLAVDGRRDHNPGGLAPSTSWPCTAACTAPWPRRSPGGCWAATPPPAPPHHRCPHRCRGAGTRAGRGAVGRRRPEPLTLAWPPDRAGRGDRARNGGLCGWNGRIWTWMPARSGSVRPAPSSTRPSFPITPTPTRLAGAGGWPSGRSSPAPAAPSSPCHPSRSRRCAAPPPAGPTAPGPGPARHRAVALGGTRPATPPGRVGPGVPHRAGHGGHSNHASRAFAHPGGQCRAGRPPAPAAPCPGLGLAAEREPASSIAAQLRATPTAAPSPSVDTIHQLPQTAPRLAGVIEGVFGPASRDGRAVSAGRRAEGKRRETQPRGHA